MYPDAPTLAERQVALERKIAELEPYVLNLEAKASRIWGAKRRQQMLRQDLDNAILQLQSINKILSNQSSKEPAQ